MENNDSINKTSVSQQVKKDINKNDVKNELLEFMVILHQLTYQRHTPIVVADWRSFGYLRSEFYVPPTGTCIIVKPC